MSPTRTVAHQAPLVHGFPSKNTGVSYHFLLQGIFPTWGSNLHLLHWQGGSLPLSHLGSLVPRLCHSFRGCALLPSRLKRGMGVCSRSHSFEMLEAGSRTCLPSWPAPFSAHKKTQGPIPLPWGGLFCEDLFGCLIKTGRFGYSGSFGEGACFLCTHYDLSARGLSELQRGD